MRGKKISEELKAECIKLRIQERLSYNEIHQKLNIPKSSLNNILKKYPLSPEDLKVKLAKGFLKLNKNRIKKNKMEESKYFKMIDQNNLSRQDKAKIAESAVLFRLCLLKYIVYGSPFDGDKADWIIEKQNNPGAIKRIQVRWTKQAKEGLPLISLVCVEHGKQKRFQRGDFDFIVGYCLKNDTAYIYSFEETKHLKATVSVSKESEEAWNKIEAVVAQG